MTTANLATLWIGRVWSAAALLAVAAIVYGAIRGRLIDRRTDRLRRRADVTEALRLAETWADVDPIEPARVEQIRANVVASDELAARRRDGWVRR